MEDEIFDSFGQYTGEPALFEILQRKEYRDRVGPDHLAIKKICPACGNDDAVWVRNQWAICYACELAFDAFEGYIDLTIDEEMEGETGGE